MSNKIIYKDQQFALNEMLRKCVELAIYELELAIGSVKTQNLIGSYGCTRENGKVYIEKYELVRQIPMEQLKLFAISLKR